MKKVISLTLSLALLVACLGVPLSFASDGAFADDATIITIEDIDARMAEFNEQYKEWGAYCYRADQRNRSVMSQEKLQEIYARFDLWEMEIEADIERTKQELQTAKEMFPDVEFPEPVEGYPMVSVQYLSASDMYKQNDTNSKVLRVSPFDQNYTSDFLEVHYYLNTVRVDVTAVLILENTLRFLSVKSQTSYSVLPTAARAIWIRQGGSSQITGASNILIVDEWGNSLEDVDGIFYTRPGATKRLVVS